MKSIAIIGFNNLVLEVLQSLADSGAEAIVFAKNKTNPPLETPNGCRIILLNNHDISSLKKHHYEVILVAPTEDLVFSLACLAHLKQPGTKVIFCADKKNQKVLGECLNVTETICIEEVMAKILAEKLLTK